MVKFSDTFEKKNKGIRPCLEIWIVLTRRGNH